MPRDIMSVLGIDPNLGINEEFVPKRVGTKLESSGGTFDAMRTDAEKRPAAQELLGDSLWSLLQQVGDAGTERLVVKYLVERVGYAPSSADYRNSSFDYRPVKKNQRVYVLDEGEGVATCMTSQLEALESLRLYAGHSNSRVTLGLANETHHLALLRSGPNLRQVLLRMWLLHLDVLAGADVSVRVDNTQVRQQLPTNLTLEEECEYAKRLTGVRVHVNSLDDTARALLCYACGLSQGDGLSDRAARYIWEPIDLTFYGGVLPVAREVDLRDPAGTSRCIVAFAEKYGVVLECGEALRMALHMYGSVNPANKLSLSLGVTRLHQQTHQKQMVRANYRCHELGGRELVALAMLIGEGIDSALGHTLHSAVRKMGLYDTPNMYPYLEPRARLLKDAADSLRVNEWLSNFFVADAYVRRNVRYLYSKEGVLHAMCLGIVVAGSLLEDATQPFEVPSRGAGQCTDDVLTASQASDDASRWLLLSAMLLDGLGCESGTRAAMAKVADPDEALDDDCPMYAGARVKMGIVCFGGTTVLRRLAKTNFAFQPTAPEVHTDNTVRSDELVHQDRMAEQPANADAKDWVSAVLEQRGPLASTTTRRANRSIDAAAELDEAPEVLIDEIPDQLHDAVEQVIERGWAEQPTSGMRLECGANALHQSLRAHHEIHGSQAPTRDEVLTALKASLTPAERQRSEDSGVPIEDNNFTADQMAAALQRFGPYALGVIGGESERAHAMVVGDGEPIFVRNSAGHWSGIGPGHKRIGRYEPRGQGGGTAN
ncbi:84 kDa protein [Penicillium janczewskii chrysovirus 1]|uniref:84 kDa protein n=1 Tax=Penicillium janczewskii chrysovirus 1 TaxID=1755792 RepID=A0A0S2KP99_9VIRU|nr:84 kDa protein [Penicillium janczewskii chrysovirus 1]ALO50143.1 84 kDa protein [Penicillium janczewskii chrysovirus 1]